jgi:hypothetical protein
MIDYGSGEYREVGVGDKVIYDSKDSRVGHYN